MILSYHPCYEADLNLLCAGRDPDDNDRKTMQAAAAIILPQGCRQSLYQLATDTCQFVFPNYDARFAYPGKTGQIRLFESINIRHPQTWTFEKVAQFNHWRQSAPTIAYPLVFKLNWGGEGRTVKLVESPAGLDQALFDAAKYEKSGQYGFLIQTFIPHANRTLRMVIVGQTLKAYWRVQDDSECFGTSLINGARIEHAVRPEIMHSAVLATSQLCKKTRIDLAGLDFIYHESDLTSRAPRPLILEINYFFGRTGLGGSSAFYTLLQGEIDRWLNGLIMKNKLQTPESMTRDQS